MDGSEMGAVRLVGCGRSALLVAVLQLISALSTSDTYWVRVFLLAYCFLQNECLRMTFLFDIIINQLLLRLT